MPDLSMLGDCQQLAALGSQATATRESLAGLVAAKLGKDWSPTVNPQRDCLSPALIHLPTGLEFLVIPGGKMTYGITAEDSKRVYEFVGNHGLKIVEGYRAAAMPALEVTVAPFLCSRQLLSLDDFARLFPGTKTNPFSEYADVERAVAQGLVQSLGFRLPSDVELEWLARDTQQHSFVLGCVVDAPSSADPDDDEVFVVDVFPQSARLGVLDLFRPQWAADDLFIGHEGAKASSHARLGGDPQGVRRFERFDYREIGEEAIAWELCARREPGAGLSASVRLALSVELA